MVVDGCDGPGRIKHGHQKRMAQFSLPNGGTLFSLRNDITGRISPVLETAFSEQRFCFFFYDINSIPVSYFVTIKRERKRKRQVKKGRTETEKKRRPK